MQVIEEVEETPRGAYAGAFGWISADGRADLGVVIRSLMTDRRRPLPARHRRRHHRALRRRGASGPSREWKAERLLAALASWPRDDDATDGRMTPRSGTRPGWSCSSTSSRSPASARSPTCWRPTTPAPASASTSSRSPRSGRSGPASPLYSNIRGDAVRTSTMLLGMAVLGVMIAAIPEIRGEHATAFAIAYVVGRLIAARPWQRDHGGGRPAGRAGDLRGDPVGRLVVVRRHVAVRPVGARPGHRPAAAAHDHPRPAARRDPGAARPDARGRKRRAAQARRPARPRARSRRRSRPPTPTYPSWASASASSC